MKKVIVVNFVATHSLKGVIRMVSGLVCNGCRVLAIISKNMPEIDEWRKLQGIELYEVDGYTDGATFLLKLGKFYMKDAPRIKQYVKSIHATSMYVPIATYWSCFVNQILSPLDYVYTMHDPIPHSKLKLAIIHINYILGRNAKYVVILSDSFRTYVREHYRKEDTQVVTIPNGDESEAEDHNILKTICYDDSKVNFLFQGRIDKYKGLNILALAYGKLRNKYSNITLTVACSGDFSKYEAAFKDLKDCTIINRWISDSEVRGLFNDRSVITVLPYLSATQSGVINTAMPSGSPVIATRCGGIVEQIEDGVTGYLAEPNNVDDLYKKMEYVINHPEELELIRMNAYHRMKKLDWNILAKHLSELL